jgi:hypothetical protein
MRLTVLLRLFVATIPAAAACGSGGEGTGTSEPELVEDIVSMTKRPGGLFDVRCRDGRFEIASADQIRANQVCNGGGPPVGTALRVRYACDGSSQLEIRALRGNGTEAVERVPFSFSSQCRNATSSLSATRSQITRPTFVAVCDNKSTLQRFAVSPTNGLSRISPTPCRESRPPIGTPRYARGAHESAGPRMGGEGPRR